MERPARKLGYIINADPMAMVRAGPSRIADDSDSSLCQLCSMFTWERYFPTWAGRVKGLGPLEIKDLLESGSFRHHESLQSLQTSARDCPFCALIEQEILQNYAWRARQDDRVQTLAKDFVQSRGHLLTQDLQLSNESLQSRIILWADMESASSCIRIACAEWLEEEILRDSTDILTFTELRQAMRQKSTRLTRRDFCSTLEVHTLEGTSFINTSTVFAKCVQGDPYQSLSITTKDKFTTNSHSSSNLPNLIKLIEGCVLKHEECSIPWSRCEKVENYARPLPKRVLKIGGPSSQPVVCLTEGLSICDRYVALSYCWGSSKHPYSMTTTSRIEDMQNEISIKKLPKTHRDAIVTTRALGIEYLWIDSLCILQDSHTDWEIESKKMDQYYGNSYVTICVDGAEGTDGGFLNPKESSPFDPIHLEQELSSRQIGNLFISRPVYKYDRHIFQEMQRASTGLWYVNVEVSPLACRAWALQERLLSPRKLHYGKDRIFWECRRYSEPQLSSSINCPWDLVVIANAFVCGNLAPEHWYYLVEHYSARGVTRLTDRLKAISGMARAYHKSLGEEFLAGLLKHDLHYGLSWQVRADAPGHRSIQAQFPTWSWASIEVEVTYGSPRSSYDEEQAFEVISTNGPPLDDPYDSAPGMYLKLRGYLQRTKLRSEVPRSIFAPAEMMRTSGRESSVEGGLAGDYYDDSQLARNGNDFFCLKLFDLKPVSGPSIPSTHQVVVLVPATDRGDKCYRRVGSALVFHDDWFKDSMLEDITIY